MGFAFSTTPCLKFARPPKPLVLCAIKCDGFFFPECRYVFHLSFHPSDEGWHCNSISAQKKGAQLSTVRCAFSCGRFRMRCFYFILFYLRYLRGECVSYFRIWHVSCELPTMGSFTVVSLLPLWRCYNFVGPFLCERK